MKKIVIVFILMLLFFVLNLQVYAQIDLDEVDANHDFQRAVISYHRGEFNQSILSLEKALSLKPDWEKTKLWLGNSYYRAGFTNSALEYWQEVIDSGGGSVDLRAKVDNISYLRSLGPELKDTPRFVLFHEISGVSDNYSIFKRPSSIFPGTDGGFYLTSFATNEIQKFSANGVVIMTIRGGLNGINHPFDIIENKDFLFISEYSSDRIIRTSKEGTGIFRFGQSGSGEGELLGPQFLTADENKHLYVTESGNRRISKYSFDGDFLFSFGQKNDYFEGFLQPTGIAYFDNQILVADGRKKELFLFDTQGNYLKSFASDLLSSPEGITVYSKNKFLIADGNNLLLFNVLDGNFSTLSSLDSNARILKASRDINGNIISVDFNGNKVVLLSDFTRMYTGLNLNIDRILSDNFPEVLVEFTVQTVDGSPYVGLQKNNFLLTEDSYTNDSMALIAAGSKTDFVDISYLIEASPSMEKAANAKVDGMKDLLDTIAGKGSINIITAEETPVLELEHGNVSDRIIDALTSEVNYSRDWSFDLGMRLAASELMGGGYRKAVVFLSTGKLNSNSFSHYDLTETLDYLKNNNIVFYTVSTNSGKVSPELEFLSRKTGGLVLPLYGPAGLNDLVSNLRSKPSGSYTLKFRTSRDSDFGRRPLPVEVQVSHFGRSGKDSSLFYGPAK